MSNTELILSELEKNVPKQFTLFSNEKGYARFQNEHTNAILTIGLGDVLLGCLPWMKASISFFSIEQILRPAFAKDKDTNYSVTLTTDNHGTLLQKPIGQGVYEHLPLTLDSAEALEKAKMLITRFIEQDALPFFEYWNDIRAFLPFLETNDLRFVANEMFYNEGMYKKIIIWKLCSHPRYQEFVAERKAVYENKPYLNMTQQKDYKILLSLIKKLEKTPALYEWDESYLQRK